MWEAAKENDYIKGYFGSRSLGCDESIIQSVIGFFRSLPIYTVLSDSSKPKKTIEKAEKALRGRSLRISREKL